MRAALSKVSAPQGWRITRDPALMMPAISSTWMSRATQSVWTVKELSSKRHNTVVLTKPLGTKGATQELNVTLSELYAVDDSGNIKWIPVAVADRAPADALAFLRTRHPQHLNDVATAFLTNLWSS